MKHGIEEVTMDQPQRGKIIEFLAHFEDEERDSEYWSRRLDFWWDRNPAADQTVPKGWVLTHDEIVVGFMGLIPFDYICAGERIKALGATTWRVAAEHRNASLPMFLKLQRLTDRYPVLDTTPNPEVQKILQKFQYQSRTVLRSSYFFVRPNTLHPFAFAWNVGSLLSRGSLPNKKLRLVTLKDLLHTEPASATNVLQKHITPEYLKWYCSGPGLEKKFIGCLNESGSLSSYLILTETKVKGHDALSIIDYWSARAGMDEVLGLIGHLCSNQDWFGAKYRVIVFNSLEAEDIPKGWFVPRRRNAVRHYFSMPKELKEKGKRCVLAEGDVGC